MNPFDEPNDSNPFSKDDSSRSAKVNVGSSNNPFDGSKSVGATNYPFNTMVKTFENNADRIQFGKGVVALQLYGFGNDVCVQALTQTLDLAKALLLLTSKVREQVAKDPVGAVPYTLWKAPYAARVGRVLT